MSASRVRVRSRCVSTNALVPAVNARSSASAAIRIALAISSDTSRDQPSVGFSAITRAGRFEPQQRPYRDHRATIAIANVKRTFWSPKWSRTRDHGPVLNGTDRHVWPIFAIQINTCQDRTKRVETATNKFRVRCFQPLSHLSAAEGTRAPLGGPLCSQRRAARQGKSRDGRPFARPRRLARSFPDARSPGRPFAPDPFARSGQALSTGMQIFSPRPAARIDILVLGWYKIPSPLGDGRYLEAI